MRLKMYPYVSIYILNPNEFLTGYRTLFKSSPEDIFFKFVFTERGREVGKRGREREKTKTKTHQSVGLLYRGSNLQPMCPDR